MGWLTTPTSFREQLSGELDRIRPLVFSSYAHRDAEVAHAFQRELRNFDVHAWRDQASIEPGGLWERSIEFALAEMQILLVLVSRASAASEWVQREVAEFSTAGKRVIPVIIDSDLGGSDALPAYLRDYQSVDGTVREEVYRDLARQIRVLLR